jgi:hypothetical protein
LRLFNVKWTYDVRRATSARCPFAPVVTLMTKHSPERRIA